MTDPRPGANASGRWRGRKLDVVVAIFVASAALAPQPGMAASRFADIQRLNAELLGSDSATVVLNRWCAERHLAEPPVVVARRLGERKPATAQVRALLGAAPDEDVRYRRVALMCGRHVLSLADNWYRPAALTPQMNAALAAGETPFGAVVAPLRFHRQNLAAEVLRSPSASRRSRPILRQWALLETPDGVPFSYVVETYLAGVLGSAP
jgi:chorismate-pyruvate lyase